MKHRKIIAATREVVCPECGGSGMRMGCTREIECFDCGGEGSWEEDEEEQFTTVHSDPLKGLEA